MDRSVVSVKTMTLEDEMKYKGTTVLTYKIEYPQFTSQRYKKSLAIINRYYKRRALKYQQKVRNRLYKMAVEDYLFAVENDYPVRVYEALLTFDVTYNKRCILSLYFDKYEYTGGAHGNTKRYSQTFNLQDDVIALSDLFRCSFDYKIYIFNKIKKQIEENPDIYFADAQTLMVEAFDKHNFYCTPKGIVIYYQQYDIAPYSTGIVEFFIPYDYCVINPIRLCNIKK